MEILSTLNTAQKTAVTTPPGPTIVLAGPGSGKTRVLTHRVVYLIEETKVAPWHILAVTFTNKAAREMNYRIEDLLGVKPRGLMVGTFHALCVRILRQEAEQVGYGRDFVIFDTADQLQVVKQALADLNLDDKKFSPNRMLNGISNAKNELVTPEAYESTNYISEINRRVYAQYQEVLQANNAMDFDDLLLNVVLLFEEQADVLQKYQERYHHILVDEFQDTNTAQYMLLKRLAMRHKNIFVVGDSDQSIYRWRGADFRNIQRFRQEYPEAQMILLEQNYRSTQIILDAAKSVIQLNRDRVHKDLFTERQGGKRIRLREAYNEMEEAELAVDTIQNLILDGYNPADFAVMYRTNSQSRALEEAFVRANMPYRLVGATQFYKRREIKDVIAYLRLVHNLADAVSFGRVVNTPTRGIGKKTQDALMGWAGDNGWQPGQALLQLVRNQEVQHPFKGRAKSALFRFGEMLAGWWQLHDEIPVVDLFDIILEQIEYRKSLDDGTAEGRDRWQNVMELRSVAATATELDLSEFLEQLALVSETDNLEETANAPTLLTLHAAKGLEFPVVLITGLEEGMLPHSRSFDDGEELAEERRLFYVGITRAKDRLFLSHAFRRTHFGETEVKSPSRFLQDIPVTLVEGVSSGLRREQAKSRASSWQWSSDTTTSSNSRQTGQWSSATTRRSRGSQTTPQAKRPSTPTSYTIPDKSLPQPNVWEDDPPVAEMTKRSGNQVQYQTGQKVRHSKFGEGTVIESQSVGNDEEVTIAFPGVGIKRLVASFAKLEVIGE